MQTRTTVLLILALLFIITSCSPAASTRSPAPTTTTDGATLIRERCSRCHPLARVERSSHTSDEWKSIVDNMVSRGARLTPEEESVVVDYLAANFGK